jgi:cobalt-zinc-cadmium efflux system membrane fusion protein
MRIFSRFLKLGLLLLSFNLPLVQASSEAPEATEPAKGPHGGRLFEKDGFAVEISIYESGVPPEMRVFSFANNQPVAPKDVQLSVTLSRLDGEQNQLSFAAEADYLLGNATIVEPHSYAVTVKAVHQGKTYEWQYDSFEGRVELNDRMLNLTGIKTERATARVMTQKLHLFGVISADPSRQYRIQSPYNAEVQQVLVELGQSVNAGQPLVKLMNTNTLKTFVIKAPASGIVTSRLVNPGQVVTGTAEAMLEVVDFSQVFVELSAFPNDISQLKAGQRVNVFDMHHAEQTQSNISFIAPAMTDGHIARVRAILDNKNGHWRPGMHVNADIVVAEREVPLAVRKNAVQSFRDMAVVFAKYGNTFEVRMLEFGIEDDEYIEVLSGLKPDTEYATDNSFLLKADVEKDGASHDH